eukprot:1764671-Lingulodinium_polyedra.AAC.1
MIRYEGGVLGQEWQICRARKGARREAARLLVTRGAFGRPETRGAEPPDRGEGVGERDQAW